MQGKRTRLIWEDLPDEIQIHFHVFNKWSNLTNVDELLLRNFFLSLFRLFISENIFCMDNPDHQLPPCEIMYTHAL